MLKNIPILLRRYCMTVLPPGRWTSLPCLTVCSDTYRLQSRCAGAADRHADAGRGRQDERPPSGEPGPAQETSVVRLTRSGGPRPPGSPLPAAQGWAGGEASWRLPPSLSEPHRLFPARRVWEGALLCLGINHYLISKIIIPTAITFCIELSVLFLFFFF